MANEKTYRHKSSFPEEINYIEIKSIQMMGDGMIGYIYRGQWNNNYVTIRYINTENISYEYIKENVRQLTRVNHSNIVKLYGVCMSNPECLMMEHVEGMILYNVLYYNPNIHYNLGHALSWTLQCAEGITYLHNMKPKPYFLRDLKLSHLILVNGGKSLKIICTLGITCDNMYPTINKDNTVWMAPEVFEGKEYTEKSEVYNWGLMLWQVLTRQKIFGEFKGDIFKVMYAIYEGIRPPMIEQCPYPLQDLMIQCWNLNPNVRPTIEHIVYVMKSLIQFCPEYDQPLIYTAIQNYCYT